MLFSSPYLFTSCKSSVNQPYIKIIHLFLTLFLFLWKETNFLPSFSLAQRKEAKETSTLTHPSPIWEGSTAPTRRSFIKVSSPHQRGGLSFLSACALVIVNSQFSIWRSHGGVNCSKRGEYLKNPLKSLLSCFVGIIRVRIFAAEKKVNHKSNNIYSREG